jgi:hypothetical protein
MQLRPSFKKWLVQVNILHSKADVMLLSHAGPALHRSTMLCLRPVAANSPWESSDRDVRHRS